MSKHSKNCTASTVFTYAEKQKLKNVYGTIETRIGQDSVKKFDECSICHSRFIEPTACDHGHTFCRSCVIEFLVKQKQKMQDQAEEFQKQTEKQKKSLQEGKLKVDVKKLEDFEKYDSFGQVTERDRLLSNNESQTEAAINKSDIKPTGMYQLNGDKDRYLKSSFWTIENTPDAGEKVEKQGSFVKCPGSAKVHKLTLKKLRSLQCKQIQGGFHCWICSKEISRQKIGCYKCGHVICQNCKSEKCELCNKAQGWMEIEGTASAFSSHNQVEIKTYTHAFIS